VPGFLFPTSKLMLTILAGVATWEREIMLERQREGIPKAKAAGIYKGLPPSIDRAKIRELLTQMGPAGAAKTMVSRDRLFTSWVSPHDERCTDA
jgi:DNA invertase Pin-like site-specific DNA recombinase